MKKKERKMSIEEYVNEVVREYKENPLTFHQRKIKITSFKEDTLAIIEKMLLERIPNLIITHSDTDTEEDIKRQIEKINRLLDDKVAPYFIDFSNKKVKKIYSKRRRDN